MGVDWGRWVNISYVHAIIFFIYLYKNKFLIALKKSKIVSLKFFSKNMFILLFVIYCFGWNPKTLLTGDVASFPGYRVPYKIFKIVLMN